MQPPPEPRPSDPASLLGVRVSGRKAWKPVETLVHRGHSYRLCGAFLGSQFCGHQTALARLSDWSNLPNDDDESARTGLATYAFADADAAARQIGPITWKSKPDALFGDMAVVLPFSLEVEGSRYCNFDPANKEPNAVLRSHVTAQLGAQADSGGSGLPPSGDRDHGFVNVDWVYCPCPSDRRSDT